MAASSATLSPSATPGLAVRARDVTFEVELRDSCNCCGMRGKTLVPASPVYINRDGHVEKFDRRKAGADIAAASFRSAQHLRDKITSAAAASSRDAEAVFAAIQTRLGVDVREIDRAPLQFDTLVRINGVLLEVLGRVD